MIRITYRIDGTTMTKELGPKEDLRVVLDQLAEYLELWTWAHIQIGEKCLITTPEKIRRYKWLERPLDLDLARRPYCLLENYHVF